MLPLLVQQTSLGGSFEPAYVKIERFLTAMDDMALPRFEVSDIEQGDMVPVLQSLKALKASFSDGGYDKNSLCAKRRWSLPEDDSDSKGDDRNFIDGFQSKEESEIDISDAKISELLKSNSLRNAPTRSLFDMLEQLLDECVKKMNGHVSHAMASLLSALVQVIEQRISNQADNLKNQNILFRVREEKYRSRIKVLETLAAGTTQENEIVTNCMEHIKLEKTRIEERERAEEKDVVHLKMEKERTDAEIRKLKQELKLVKETHENQCLELEAKAQNDKVELEKKLKDAELQKDEELQNFQKPTGNNATVPKRGLSKLRLLGPSSPRRHSIGASPNARRGKTSDLIGRTTSDVDNCSEYSSKNSDSGSPHSSDELKHRKDLLHQPSKFAGGGKETDVEEDIELIGLADADSEERLSDISDSCLSMGTETDGSVSSVVELTLFPETEKPLEISERPEAQLAPEKPEKSVKMGNKTEPKERSSIPSKIPKQTLKPPGQTRLSRLSVAASSSSKALTSNVLEDRQLALHLQQNHSTKGGEDSRFIHTAGRRFVI
ncbi:hypothetical protein F2Q69_00040945 [Brassica cretica]|uniref:Uncharacterized protein n=1 Tax=Brassica cretica TaxID=69181 RepID=A0A8S9NM49_BRACR|nr:hypothetical protein F2Q69_00040945 [Brassica cretica]